MESDMLTARHPDYSEQACDNPSTPLDNINDLARQADRISDVIQSFLERCRGSGGTAEGAKEPPHPTGHLNNLERLTKNLNRVQELAAELSTIG
jgi:hypothetical protein